MNITITNISPTHPTTANSTITDTSRVFAHIYSVKTNPTSQELQNIELFIWKHSPFY